MGDSLAVLKDYGKILRTTKLPIKGGTHQLHRRDYVCVQWMWYAGIFHAIYGLQDHGYRLSLPMPLVLERGDVYNLDRATRIVRTMHAGDSDVLYHNKVEDETHADYRAKKLAGI